MNKPMLSLRAILAFSLAIASCILAVPALGAPSGLSRQELRDQDFRQQFGLRHDAAFVTQMADRKRGRYGVPLLATEARELDARLERNARDGRLVLEYLEDIDAGDFGGMFFDQRNGGVLRVGFTNNLAQHTEALDKLLDAESKVRTHAVDNSQRQLDRVHDAIAADALDLRAEGIKLHYVRTSARRNLVEIGVGQPTQLIIRDLRSRYGARFVNVVGARPSRPENRVTEPSPWKAGLEINTSSGGACTMGFSAYEDTGGAIGYYQLSASHCKDHSYHNGSPFGTLAEYTTDGRATANSEASSFSIDEEDVSNRLYLDGGSTTNYITDVQSPSEEIEGQAQCKSGRTTGVTCGTLNDRDYSAVIPSDNGLMLVTNLRTSTVDSDGGDSGAPVYGSLGDDEYQAQGILFGDTSSFGCLESVFDCDMIYSQVTYVIQDLGLTDIYLGPASIIDRDNPTAYFLLDEKAEAKTTVGDLPGRYKDVGYSTTGPLGDDPSARFRGLSNDSSIEVDPYGALDMSSSFSLEAWVNLAAYQSGAGNGLIYKGPSGGAANHYLNGGNYNLTIQADGTVRFAYQYQHPTDPTQFPSYTVSTPATTDGKVPLGSWTHVVAVYDAAAADCANKMAIYINGVQRACGPTLGQAEYAPWVNTKPLFIGKRADTSNTNGSIDELAIYGNALSASTVANHYAARTSPSTYKFTIAADAPVAYYELNEAPWMRDHSGEGAHGEYIGYTSTMLDQPGLTTVTGSGRATAFSGQGRGEVDGANAAVNQAGDFTVEAWVKPAVITSGARTIVSKGAVGSHGGNYWLLTYGDDFNFWYRTKLASCTESCTFTNNIISWANAGSRAIDTAATYHVAAVVDMCDFPATECYAKLYVNGELEGQKSMRDIGGNSLAPATNTSPFRIGLAGASASGVYSFAGGVTDDVAIFGEALSQDRIRNHYHAGS